MSENNEDCKIIKYADDTVVLGLIQNQNEDHYFKTIKYVLQWCKDNHLDLNVTKTKEMIHDFRKSQTDKEKVTINGTEVTSCSEYKYLGCFIQADLKWTTHIDEQVKKCNKRQFLLRILNNVNVDGKILALYYNSMIINVLTYVICSWYKSCGTEFPPPPTCHMTCVACHMSRVTCPMSHVKGHV